MTIAIDIKVTGKDEDRPDLHLCDVILDDKKDDLWIKIFEYHKQGPKYPLHFELGTLKGNEIKAKMGRQNIEKKEESLGLINRYLSRVDELYEEELKRSKKSV